jgi:hypothetical protein
MGAVGGGGFAGGREVVRDSRRVVRPGAGCQAGRGPVADPLPVEVGEAAVAAEGTAAPGATATQKLQAPSTSD